MTDTNLDCDPMRKLTVVTAAFCAFSRLVFAQTAASVGTWDVRVDLVRDDAPAAVRIEAVRRVRELIELQHLATGKEVLVVPVLVSKGTISRDKIPNDLKGLPVV